MLRAVRHIGVVVADMETSLHFYCDLLGLESVRELDESGQHLDAMLALDDVRVRTVKLRAADGPTLVELLEFASPSPVPRRPRLDEIGPTHLALTVAEVDRLYDDLVSAGVALLSPPQTSRDGLARIVFCRDPDGTPIELVEEVAS